MQWQNGVWNTHFKLIVFWNGLTIWDGIQQLIGIVKLYNQKLLQIYKKLRRLETTVGVYKILQTPASNIKAQTLARNIYFNSDLNS